MIVAILAQGWACFGMLVAVLVAGLRATDLTRLPVVNGKLLPREAVQLNVSEWWASLIPPAAPHRPLVLAAVDAVSRVLRALLSVMFELRHPHCSTRRAAVEAAREAILALSAAMPAPDRGEVRNLDYFGVWHGPASLLRSWIGWIHAHAEALHEDWERVLACIGEDFPFPVADIGDRFFALFVSMETSQHIFPWLVDSAAVLAREKSVRATVPVSMSGISVDADILVALLRPNDVVVEVGVDRGQTSEALLQKVPGLALFGVDPYPGFYHGVASARRGDQMGGMDAYSEARAVYRRYKDRAVLIRNTSVLTARSFPDLRRTYTPHVEQARLVFIDGEHDYANCLADIRAWTPHAEVVARR